MSNRPMTFTKRPALLRIERILAALAAKPMTTPELAEAIHLSSTWCAMYVKHLHSTKRIYISAWVYHVEGSDRMYPRAVYRPGTHSDAFKPAPLTEAERGRRAWKLVRDDPERRIQVNARRRARKLQPKANPLTLWISP